MNTYIHARHNHDRLCARDGIGAIKTTNRTQLDILQTNPPLILPSGTIKLCLSQIVDQHGYTVTISKCQFQQKTAKLTKEKASPSESNLRKILTIRTNSKYNFF